MLLVTAGSNSRRLVAAEAGDAAGPRKDSGIMMVAHRLAEDSPFAAVVFGRQPLVNIDLANSIEQPRRKLNLNWMAKEMTASATTCDSSSITNYAWHITALATLTDDPETAAGDRLR